MSGVNNFTTPLETIFELAEDDPATVRRRREWRQARAESFASRVVHHKKFPGCLWKYRTTDPSEQFRYHGRFNMDAWHEAMSASEFRRFYRLPKAAFKNLVELLSPYLNKDFVATGRFSSVAQAKRSNGKGVRRITTEYKVSIGLRWLAGASYLDIAGHHGVSKTTVFRVKNEFVAAVNAAPALAIKFPALTDDEKLRSIAEGFEKLSYCGLFKDCVGAIDGVLLHLHSVSATDSPEPNKYFTRKGSLAWNVQAVVDAKRKFTYYSIRCPGSVHDAVAFSFTDLYYELEAKGIVGNFHFVADAAYGGMVGITTPFTWTGNLSQAQSAYNYHLSSIRIEVECAFGLLLSRWGILWKGLRMPLQATTRVIEACLKLHNFAIDWRDETAPPTNLEFPGHLNGVQVQGYPCRHGSGCQRPACQQEGQRAREADAPRLSRRGAPSDHLWHDAESQEAVRAGNRSQGARRDGGAGRQRGQPRERRRYRDMGREIRAEMVQACAAMDLKRPRVKRFGERQTAKVMQQAYNNLQF
mmetsp:Transcript_29919/g.61508  ORF Transcript_29919/g.61508 Transcript_29919/m.61508 type:complete len:527 (+) Transcript_29919:908-2488(+)